jgi:hypothetical protein
MNTIDRRKLMVGSAEEEFAPPGTIVAFAESFRRVLTIYNTMPPEVQKAFLVFLEWTASSDDDWEQASA